MTQWNHAARVGDVVVEISCKCGTVLVAARAIGQWQCFKCRRPALRGKSYTLLKEGWEEIR